jgi:hypothetical protein
MLFYLSVKETMFVIARLGLMLPISWSAVVAKPEVKAVGP